MLGRRVALSDTNLRAEATFGQASRDRHTNGLLEGVDQSFRRKSSPVQCQTGPIPNLGFLQCSIVACRRLRRLLDCNLPM